MLSAVLVTVLGLTASIALVQLTGLRLSGVVVVSLVALATLVAVSVHPVFLGSVAVAIAAVGLSSQRTSIHRRALVLASLAAGAIVPVAGTLAMSGLSLPVTSLKVPTELEPLTAMAPDASADARGVE
ncbi:poly-gamma-glutamate biosynthesis protein PgsC/CapC [Natrinema limicola]|uniref:poly-gamma-glutamate biosynthesis protein PgsC/CapC n=1 Tax=Natrinema limicola TaxID=370323 RepID=UPI00067806AA|nr:poly-gamma-glutamate biosynthesis protein PgsC/CapC [Natrinema limicola]